MRLKNILLICIIYLFNPKNNPTMNRFKLVALLAFLMIAQLNSRADEGMWLISLLNKNMHEMQKLGLKLTAEDIYSINSSSLKDAVVMLDDGGCSAEIVSAKGLVLTNHHCAVSDIQYHSSAEQNLLHDGFWANTFEEELPVPDKTALILNRVEDVTDRIKQQITNVHPDKYFEEEQEAIATLISEYESSSKHEHFMVVPMFSHNQYMLFVYTRFTDVRLVGAPPSSIGNFGGDVDNWRWPRHTGDFALFRIYTSPNGNPADYSTKNIPYKPKHHFAVSTSGVNEGDFTMTIGYPGSTHRLSTSYHAQHERDVVAPWVDEVWGSFIDILKDGMKADANVKVDYTDTHDMLVNFWQKDTYQAESMKRFDVVNRLNDREVRLKQWISQKPSERASYLLALNDVDEYYNLVADSLLEQQYRAIDALINWPVEVSNNIYEMYDLFMLLVSDKPSKRKVKREAKRFAKRLPEVFENYYPEIDMQLYSAALVSLVKHLPDSTNEPILDELAKQEFPEYFVPLVVEHFFNQSIFTSQERMAEFLAKPTIDSLAYDPLFMMQLGLENYSISISDRLAPHRQKLKLAYKIINKGYLDMDADSVFYPDANSTMRLSYGKVIGYKPFDGIVMHPTTSLKGIMDKENPEDDVFIVPQKLKELYNSNDFASYANGNSMPVCFLTDNDITNGNSGSPVLNANGNLIGVAFDGNYEAMACDFMYEPHMQRTIVVDIRYVLFVIDKFANAKRLVDEMTLVAD